MEVYCKGCRKIFRTKGKLRQFPLNEVTRKHLKENLVSEEVEYDNKIHLLKMKVDDGFYYTPVDKAWQIMEDMVTSNVGECFNIEHIVMPRDKYEELVNSGEM